MLNFGSYNVGASAANFWRFVGGVSPDNIELNNVLGVNGIVASLPANRNLKLLLTEFGALQISSNAFSDGNVNLQNGIGVIAGAGYATIQAEDIAAGSDSNYVHDGSSIQEQFADGVSFAFKIIDSTSSQESYSDMASSDLIQRETTATEDQLKAIPANVGANALVRKLNKDEFYIQHGTAGKLFAVLKDGKVQTNQTQAAGVHAVLAAELPIYNQAGVLVGYIPIML